MFIKKVTNRKGDKTYLTYRLVKSKRVDGLPRHITILELGALPNLGVEKHKALSKRIGQLVSNQLDLLFDTQINDEVEEHAQYFFRKLIKKRLETASSESKKPDTRNIVEVDLNSFEMVEGKEIGGEWLCRQAFEELGLPGFLSDKLKFNNNMTALSLLSLMGRMLHPGSEMNTAKWLNENSGAFELVWPNSGRVDRNRLTNASVSLYRNKDKIEDYLSGEVEDIFGIEDKYFLYDLTNTHFEGSAKGCEKAKFGRNKQKRNDCRQITLGLLTDSSGLPKRSRYYEGRHRGSHHVFQRT